MLRQITQFPYSPVVKISAFYTAFEAVRPVGFTFDGESHDSWECVFVLEGKAEITAGDKVYVLEPGQVILHPPLEFHSISNESNIGLRIVIISFSADAFPIKAHGVYTFPSQEKLLHVLSRLLDVFTRNATMVSGIKDGVSPADVQLSVSTLEQYVISILYHDNEITSPKRDKRSILYRRALEVMQQNIEKRISTENIAELCNVSVSTLQKLFKRFTGLGVAKYYEEIVMERASAMVENGMRVKEIASSLGYDDQNYFSTAYKRHFGISPTKHFKS